MNGLVSSPEPRRRRSGTTRWRPGGPAALTPDLYDRAYFLTNCGGYREYLSSGGEILETRLERVIENARIVPGERVLDLGCGRGEIAVQAARRGAAVVAADYSPDALALARSIAERRPAAISGRIQFQQVDAKALPFRNGSFDCAILSDIVEHLHPWELRRCLGELARVLHPGGRVVIHTFPNRWSYDYGHPIRRLIARGHGERLPADPRSDYEKRLHVNEQTPWGLWRGLNEFFDCAVWVEPVDGPGLPGRRALSLWSPVDLLATNDIWAVGVPRSGGSLGKGRLPSPWPSPRRPPVARWPAAVAARVEDEAFFGPGWYPIEGGPPAFRWSGRRAFAFLARTGGRLVLDCASHRPPGVPPATIQVRLGSVRRTIPAPTDWDTVRVELPAARAGVPLEIVVRPAFCPAKTLGSRDARQLGIAVRRLAWE